MTCKNKYIAPNMFFFTFQLEASTQHEVYTLRVIVPCFLRITYIHFLNVFWFLFCVISLNKHHYWRKYWLRTGKKKKLKFSLQKKLSIVIMKTQLEANFLRHAIFNWFLIFNNNSKKTVQQKNLLNERFLAKIRSGIYFLVLNN
jgi:hypothetical protein